MKIKKVTYRPPNSPWIMGGLSNVCNENGKVMVGSCACDKCHLLWFRVGKFVICHSKKEQPQKEFENRRKGIHIVKGANPNKL